MTSNQTEFWEKEAGRGSYITDFLAAAENNHWIKMLTDAERKAGFEVNGKVLEIGGGSQYLSRYIAKNRDSSVICTDISSDRLSKFDEYYGALDNLTIMGNINAEKMPFNDGEFDYIVGDAVLHHIEDIRSALYEMHRCLKDDGVAVFIREPVLGMYLPIRRWLYKILDTKGADRRAIEYANANRFEYCKYLAQWNEEFYRAKLISTRYPGWYYYRFSQLAMTRLPILFTNLSVFVLKKRKEWS